MRLGEALSASGVLTNEEMCSLPILGDWACWHCEVQWTCTSSDYRIPYEREVFGVLCTLR